MIETKPTIKAEEASEVVGDLKDKDKVKEVDSPLKTMKKQCKNKDLQVVMEKEIFLKEQDMKNLKFKNCEKYGHYVSECWSCAPNHIEGVNNYIKEEHAIPLAFKGEEASENM